MNRIALMMVGLCSAPVMAQVVVTDNKVSWSENCGWMNWRDAGAPAGTQGVQFGNNFAWGAIWCENIGWIRLGDGDPANGFQYANTHGTDFGVNVASDGTLGGLAWGENVGWINFDPANLLNTNPPRIDKNQSRLRGMVWGENIGWITLDSPVHFVGLSGVCGTGDFNGDSDFGTDQDIEAFFACLAGVCCPACGTSDFNGDGDFGTDQDIEAFFRVLAGGGC